MEIFGFFGAGGIRKAIRKSYAKHCSLAEQKNAGSEQNKTSVHEAGLYGALGTRKIVRGERFHETALWDELFPFTLMDEVEAVDALAEYVVFQEAPKLADTEYLRRRVNEVLHGALPESWLDDQLESDTEICEIPDPISVAAAGFINQFEWIQLLDYMLYQAIEEEALRLMEDLEQDNQ